MPGYCFNHGGQRVEIDVRGQVIRAEVEERAGWGEVPPVERSERAGDGRPPARLENGHTWQAPVHSSVKAAGKAAGVAGSFTPLFAMAAKAKAFDARDRLAATLGEAALESPLASGSSVAMGDALVDMATLFRGAEVACRDELGQAREPDAGDRVARAAFRSWQQRSGEDPDLDIDLRVAAPIYRDVDRGTVRVCVTLGVETRTLRFEFVQRPQVHVHGASPFAVGTPEPRYVASERLIFCPVTMECDVRVPPSRQQLRELCDEPVDAAAIKRALES